MITTGRLQESLTCFLLEGTTQVDVVVLLEHPFRGKMGVLRSSKDVSERAVLGLGWAGCGDRRGFLRTNESHV